MIDGTEGLYPELANRQEWEDRMDGDSLGLGHYTKGGITLKQHMVIEFTKSILSNSGITNMDTLCYDHWKAVVGDSISIANEVIKQLNEENNGI